MIMAKLNGILSKMSGSIGGITLRNVSGNTVVCEKSTGGNDARTFAQMSWRAKWLNPIAFARLITSGVFKFAFENRKSNQSDMNMFHKYAMAMPEEDTPWLCKEMRDNGLVIPAPYMLSQGTIEEVQVQYDSAGKAFKTNLNCSATINSDTTVSQLAKALAGENTNIQYGDKLTYVMLKGKDTTEGFRYTVEAVAIVLDATDETKVMSLSTKWKQNDEEVLCLGADGNACAGVIITRRSGGKVHASNSHLCLATNAEQFYREYCGKARQAHAIEDLGGYKRQLLNPSTGSEKL